MKWNKKNIVANQGIEYLQTEVNKNGSIFRQVHQENDVGIDGFIEYVENENATGQLIAVQVKSGDSYLNQRKDKFVLYIDQEHLDYWNNFVVPVILIFYSPTLNISAYIEIKSFIKYEEYHDRLPINKIEVRIDETFNSDSISSQFKEILKVYKDEKILLESAEKCLSDSTQLQKEGFLILSNHPFSRDRKITIFIAKELLMSNDEQLCKDALFILGYGCGRMRWSWNPNNKEEKDIIDYASKLCSDLNADELRQVIGLTKGECWNGPEGLGERAIDILSCNENSFSIADEILNNPDFPIEIRGFCMYYLYEADDESIINNKESILKNSIQREVYEWIFKENEE